MNDIKHGRYDARRLALQTLINTYPDSEYLAKAKLAVADSYYKEGGTSGHDPGRSRISGFHHLLPVPRRSGLRADADRHGALRRMEKPDRDRNEALEAEGAFQTYLQKYPTSPLTPQAQQRLRDVQESAGGRRFPASHSSITCGKWIAPPQRDSPNWSIAIRSIARPTARIGCSASIYERTEHADIAAQYYTRIVRTTRFRRWPRRPKPSWRNLACRCRKPDPDRGGPHAERAANATRARRHFEQADGHVEDWAGREHGGASWCSKYDAGIRRQYGYADAGRKFDGGRIGRRRRRREFGIRGDRVTGLGRVDRSISFGEPFDDAARGGNSTEWPVSRSLTSPGSRHPG